MNHDAPSRDAATWLALGFLLCLGSGLFALMAVVLPDLFKLLLVLVGFILFFWFHYITWGYWLSRTRRSDDEEEDERTHPARQRTDPHS